MIQLTEEEFKAKIEAAYCLGWNKAMDAIRPTVNRVASQVEDLGKSNEEVRKAIQSALDVYK